MRVSQFFCKNFRTLPNVNITLRDFNVIVGPNGAGKSSLLQVINLFGGASKEGRLSDFLAYYGGFHAAVSLFRITERMGFGLGLSEVGTEHSWTYSVDLTGTSGGGYLIEHESFDHTDKPFGSLGSRIASFERDSRGCMFYLGDRGSKGSINTPSTELSISSAPGFVPEAAKLIESLNRIALWRSSSFLPDGRVRVPQQLRPVSSPASDGSDLYSALYNLRTTRKSAFSELLENIRHAIPQFEDVEFPVVGAGHVYMAWKQRDLAREIDAGQLSDGTLRLLWLLTILAYAPQDGLILIDEPELSLHPQWIQLLVALLRKKSAKTTIVVATQSAEFLRWLEPSELLIADLTEEGTKFFWADEHHDIKGWLEDFSLSQLWTMGELGGRR